MHKRKVLFFREPEVHTILLRRLGHKGYRIYPKVRVADAISLDREERLAARDASYLALSHFDFLIVKDDTPVFAVEFDGLDHLENAEVIERDTLKNRLCRLADLPLLRVTSVELAGSDEITLLDYMLMLYVAWNEEKEDLLREIEEYAANIGPEIDPEQLAVDLDPGFQFSLRHPFPGSVVVRERLWRQYRIAWELYRDSRRDAAIYFCDVNPGRSGNFQHDQFYTAEAHAEVWRSGTRRANAAFSKKVSVMVRAWLPLWPDVPTPEEIDPFGGANMEGVDAALTRFKARVDGMWFPSFPGVSPIDVAENYAEYLGFRAIERWAKDTLNIKP